MKVAYLFLFIFFSSVSLNYANNPSKTNSESINKKNQIKDFAVFLKEFAENYTNSEKRAKEYLHQDISLIQLYNPGAFCVSISNDMSISREIKLKPDVYKNFPIGDFCEGYPGIRDGFYFESINYENLPTYVSLNEGDDILVKEIEIPEEYKTNLFQKVQIIFEEYHVAYFYFIHIDEDWYLICQDYCDCSA